MGLGVVHGGIEHHTGAMPRTQPHEGSGTGHGREGGQKLRAAGMDCGVRPRLAASVANSALPSGRAIPAATQLGEHRAQVAPREGVPGLVGVPVRLCGERGQHADRPGRRVGSVGEAALVQGHADGGQAGHRVGGRAVGGQVGLSGQIGHGAPQGGGQVFEPPSALEPACLGLQH